jgi:predicted RecA/RadA family phage recombinase
MNAIYIQDGDAVDHLPATALPAGAVVVQGKLVGVSPRPIPAGTIGGLLVEGVFDLPIAPGGTADTGTPVFWNPAANQAVLDGTLPGVAYCGVTAQPLANDDLAVRVLLNHPR